MHRLIAIAVFLFCLHLKAESPEATNIASLEQAVSGAPDDLDLQYQLGLAYNDFALLAEEDENEEALEKAIAIFEDIYKQDPSRVEAQAMLGSATVLKARFSSIFTKIRWAERGFVIIDEAVEADPENVGLRLIRAANAAQVPGFLGRSDEASGDFAWLLAEIEKNPEKFDDGLRRSVYFYAGEYRMKKDDKSAADLLLKAQATPGEDRLDHRITEALAEAQMKFPEAFQK